MEVRRAAKAVAKAFIRFGAPPLEAPAGPLLFGAATAVFKATFLSSGVGVLTCFNLAPARMDAKRSPLSPDGAGSLDCVGSGAESRGGGITLGGGNAGGGGGGPLGVGGGGGGTALGGGGINAGCATSSTTAGGNTSS